MTAFRVRCRQVEVDVHGPTLRPAHSPLATSVPSAVHLVQSETVRTRPRLPSIEEEPGEDVQFTEVMVHRPMPRPALTATPVATAPHAPTSRKSSELTILALGIALGIAISFVLVILHR